MTRILISLSMIAMLSACATIEGAGQDLETAGQVISAEAREVKAKM
ncbi:entericidin A/B family lipoprotein [Actibacterium sp. XHP0104]|nr:entericidin A/B family lipoprotein [Actibacterium sp. XHP0104]MCV2882921.1 entericidin A/B family lipoprotein [Actibacterium sp. XHP0104]